MSHSRIVPAFFLVALVHLMVIGGLLATVSAPRPRPVRSEAMMAQLLQPEPADAPAIVKGAAKPPRAPAAYTPPIPLRPSSDTARMAPPARPPFHSARDAHSIAANARDAHAPASQRSSPPTMQPPQSSSNTDSPASGTQAAPATAIAPGNASSPAARETVAQPQPVPLDHGDCRIAKPTYPALSKRRGETGTATLRFTVGMRGTVDSVVLVKSSGFARLDEAAVDALRQSTCQPPLENGSPVRASYIQAFMFGLDDD
jgi:protein TonB